jgi:NosR/NirI family nitrous oxide reductase transcriptional regulator
MASHHTQCKLPAMGAWLSSVLIALVVLLFNGGLVYAASRLAEFSSQATPHEFFPKATRFGEQQGEPPILPVFAADRLLGYVYLNTDFAGAVGYSGKSVSMLVGIDTEGVITGIKLVEHKEPIVLVGVPERRVVEAVNKLIGTRIGPVAAGKERPPQPDIVSGATVTVLVMADSVVRSAVRLVRSGRISPTVQRVPGAAPLSGGKTIDQAQSEIQDWDSLLGDGSIRRLRLSIGEVNQAFEKSGKEEATANPEPGSPGETFIDLYVALVSVPTIGKSLLGEAAYKRLRARLDHDDDDDNHEEDSDKDDENADVQRQAIMVAANGIYSFKGSGYVRGGIFDRIELLQDGDGTRFRDRDHERIGALEAAGAPLFKEIGLFMVPEDFAFDPTEPWELQLLVQRATGAREKAFLAFELSYALPDRYIKSERSEKAADATPRPGETTPVPAVEQELLWKQMWRRSPISIGITGFAIVVLTGIFFFQNSLVKRPQLYTWLRRGFLVFTLVWLGWYANAQLSVVNVLTFSNSLITGFSWEYFLTAPLIFILWSSVAIALLFWGRGPYCGWLCPFGALQELTNSAAKAIGVPQIRVPWDLHERLWPIKYVIFILLFGMSLYSLTFAEQLSEVEPFKTAIILKFVRDWPFVLYAVTLLVVGLFIERFFCRYVCPLGAALAIPGRLRMFQWLRRWPECGSPCQRCANECPVQSIHPEGHINVNECIYCMHCQELYRDDQRCPHMIQVRLKRERRQALSSPSMRSTGAGDD